MATATMTPTAPFSSRHDIRDTIAFFIRRIAWLPFR
jgi:hypothetical protein